MILAIVQARCSSTRLPGKVLAPVLGRAMILRQLERLARTTEIDRLIVATSTDPSDDPLAELLEAESVEVRRGSLRDVAARFQQVAHEIKPDTIVRLTADCPLTDPAVVDRVIESHLNSGADYTSNTINRTYPQGLDVECVRYDVFESLMRMPLTETEREHVTMGLYTRPELFRLESVTQPVDHSRLRWTVDLPDDLEFVRTVYAALYDNDPKFGQDEILEFLRVNPSLNRINE